MRAKKILVVLLTVAMVLSMFSPVSLADDSGWKSASGYNDDNGVNHETRAYNSNDSYVSFDSSSDRVDYTFGSSIVPSGATITGITVQLESYRSSSSDRTFNVSLYTGSTQRGSTKNTGGLATSDAFYALGGDADTWGYSSWTDTAINTTNFQVRVQATGNSGTIYLDHIQIKVSYTAGTVTHTLTITKVGSDSSKLTVSPASGSTYPEGTEVALSATPSTGYSFVGFFSEIDQDHLGKSLCGVVLVLRQTITMNSNKTVYALYTRNTYTFNHMDVDFDGTLTIDHYINGTLESTEYIQITTSDVRTVINGTTNINNFESDSSANEWSAEGLSYTWPSSVKVYATLTDKNDPSRTFNFEHTFTASEMAIAYGHCPGVEASGSKGFDFQVNVEEIEQLFAHDVTFAAQTGGTLSGNNSVYGYSGWGEPG